MDTDSNLGQAEEVLAATDDDTSNFSNLLTSQLNDEMIVDQSSNLTNELSRGSASDFCDNNSTNLESVNFDHGDDTLGFGQENGKVCENGLEISDKSEKIEFSIEDTSNAMTDVLEIKTNDNQASEMVFESEVAAEEKAKVQDETEVVSEDELPTVQKPKVQDAENVSDDELPGPKRADLPADTEVVSEDELPAAKKEDKETTQADRENRKRKNEEVDKEQDVTESPNAEKKQAVATDDESKPTPVEKKNEEPEKKKSLPELDKYWKVVNDDPADFTGWTYLLQYVDQESDVEAAREAYDAFLSHYPYCYGYWRKYADYEKRKGSKKKCLEVLERGLKAIPLSVDLWIHYLNHIKTVRSEDHIFIRSQFERAIGSCGLEFRSDRLWEAYLKWEGEHGTPMHVTAIYDRLLSTPTLGYTTHFDNFQEHIMSNPLQNTISAEELTRVRAEVRASGTAVPTDLPPGEDEPADHIASEEEAQAVKERIIATRRKIHKSNGEQVTLRWTYEEGIKRPYFHVKPLERSQLKNWKTYLDWEKLHGSFERTLVLHERCLIACALYEEFWLKLVKFLEERMETHPDDQASLVERCREVLERACSVHHTASPALHLRWALFEEQNGDAARAADILERLERARPGLLQVAYRRANLERRRGATERAISIYESAIAAAKSQHASALAIKLARFHFHVMRDWKAADATLESAITREPLCARLYLQRLHLALAHDSTDYDKLEDILESYTRVEGADPEMTASFARRALELAEEIAPDAAKIKRAVERHRERARSARHSSKHLPSSESNKRKESSSNSTSSNTNVTSHDTTTTSNVTNNTAYAATQQQQHYNQPAWPHYPPHHAPPYNAWHQYPNYY